MSRENIFAAKLNAELAAQQPLADAWQQTNPGETAEFAIRPTSPEDERIRSLHEAKARRDAAHEGTPPEEVWGEAKARLCHDFVEFVEGRGFPHAAILRDRSWSIRAYGVGVYAMDTPAGDYIPGYWRHAGPSENNWKSAYRDEEHLEEMANTPLGFNVYLCEDTTLRTYTLRPLEVIDPNPDYRVGPRHEEYLRSAPVWLREGLSAVASLPITREGQTLVPKIGRFVTWHEPAQYAESLSEEGGGKALVAPAYDYLGIRGKDLETTLTAHALHPDPSQHLRGGRSLQDSSRNVWTALEHLLKVV